MRSGKYHHCAAIVPSITPLPAIVAIVFGTKNTVPRTVRYAVTRAKRLFMLWSGV
ncbi:MAG: hypothetical protein Q7U51_08575 [Methanoregula sp.]|nr:hypothetical protein [Methanoregula sp.]